MSSMQIKITITIDDIATTCRATISGAQTIPDKVKEEVKKWINDLMENQK